jgi:DNA/RNA endonuclease YhcR with UshA esterase domain
MEEGKILALSFAISTLGLILLLIVSAAQDPMPISSITPDDIGSRVYLSGEVSGLRTSQEGHLFFHLSDKEGTIKVATFNEVAKELPCIENGKLIEMRGVIDDYRGEIEIIPSKAEDIRC